MAETMDLKDVLKSAQTVTSLNSETGGLANEESLLAIDADGVPKRVSRRTLVNSTYQQCYQSPVVDRWHRVAKITNYASAGIVTLTTGLWAGWPRGHVLAVAFTQLASGCTVYVRQLIGWELKYRILKSGSDYFLDVFAGCNRQVTAVSGIGITAMSVVNPETEGYETIVAETTLPTVSGGVKRCTSINCGEPQKGGRHERDNGAEQGAENGIEQGLRLRGRASWMYSRRIAGKATLAYPGSILADCDGRRYGTYRILTDEHGYRPSPGEWTRRISADAQLRLQRQVAGFLRMVHRNGTLLPEEGFHLDRSLLGGMEDGDIDGCHSLVPGKEVAA